MRRVLPFVLFAALALTVPAPAQVPAVGATRDVGVDCLCPGQSITHHPAGTSCMTVCAASISQIRSTCQDLAGVAGTSGARCASAGSAWGTPVSTASHIANSTSTSLAVANAVSGVLGALGSYFAERDAANAAAAQAQAQAMAEARRLREEELERERVRQERLFEQAKASVLDRMLGVRPGDLQFKGTSAGDLQMKGLGEITGTARDAQQRAMDQFMRSRVAQLQEDLQIDPRTGLFNYQATPVGPAPPPGRTVAAGWIAEPASPPPATQGTTLNVPTPPGPANTAYSTDTGRVVAAPPLPTPSASPLAPGGMIGSDSAAGYSVDTGRIVTPPPATGTAYSIDTGRVVTPPAAGGGGAYSVDTGRIVAPPVPNPNGAYSIDTGRVVTPPAAPAGAYSVDAGRVVTPPTSNPDGAYSVDTGRVVDRPGTPGGAYSVDTGRIETPPADGGGAYSVDAGRRVTPPAGNDGPIPVTGAGAGLTPAITRFDGQYTGTVALFAPPGVVSTIPPGAQFIFDVVNGTPQSNFVLGSVGANGQLLDGRSQITLRIGPSSTIVVPIGGVFNEVLNTPSVVVGTVPCGNGVCVVAVTVTRRTVR